MKEKKFSQIFHDIMNMENIVHYAAKLITSSDQV